MAIVVEDHLTRYRLRKIIKTLIARRWWNELVFGVLTFDDADEVLAMRRKDYERRLHDLQIS